MRVIASLVSAAVIAAVGAPAREHPARAALERMAAAAGHPIGGAGGSAGGSSAGVVVGVLGGLLLLTALVAVAGRARRRETGGRPE